MKGIWSKKEIENEPIIIWIKGILSLIVLIGILILGFLALLNGWKLK